MLYAIAMGQIIIREINSVKGTYEVGLVRCSCVETELHKNRGNKLGKECNGVVCAVWMICVGCGS